MKNYDVFKDEKKNVTNYILKFEEAIKQVPIINFNNTSIEFPNMIVFTKEDKGLLYSMLNPGVEIFKVSDEDFVNMLKVVQEETDGVVLLDKKISPKTTARVNLDLLRERVVYLREYDDTFICNEVMFTTSESEFQGTGMFTGRNQVFWVNADEFVSIKNKIKG